MEAAVVPAPPGILMGITFCGRQLFGLSTITVLDGIGMAEVFGASVTYVTGVGLVGLWEVLLPSCLAGLAFLIFTRLTGLVEAGWGRVLLPEDRSMGPATAGLSGLMLMVSGSMVKLVSVSTLRGPRFRGRRSLRSGAWAPIISSRLVSRMNRDFLIS